MPFAALLNILIIGLNGAAVVFALTCGRRTERWGAAILGGNLLLIWGTQAFFGDYTWVFLSLDFAAAAAFGLLTVRSPEKVWPGAATVGQSLVFVFSATRLTNYPLTEFAYINALNLSGLIVITALVYGAWSERWGRKPMVERDLLPA